MSLPYSSISIFFILFILFGFNHDKATAQNATNVIGAIVNVNSRKGKEELVSMEIAVQTLNNASKNKNKFVLHVIDSGGKHLHAYTLVKDLIGNRTEVQAIVGMETWSDTVWIAEIANQAQVPVLSFISPSVSPPSFPWTYLVRMASNDTLQMQCVATMVRSYGWRRVIGIYEDDGYGADLGILGLLGDALGVVGTEIEQWLAFSPLSTVADQKASIQKEFEKLHDKQSRVFVMLRISPELATQIISIASHLGFLGRDSVWIATDPVASLLNTFSSTVLSSMQGIIGIKTHFLKTSPSLANFSSNFSHKFRANYLDEDNFQPGAYALLAYDAIFTVALAIEKLNNSSTIDSTSSRSLLLKNILSSNFNGLSGKIRFQGRELSRSTNYEIVNVVGENHVLLKFWSLEYGFSDHIIEEIQTSNKDGGSSDKQVLGGRVYWPGGLERVPLGWVMPSESKPLIIGIPASAAFDMFVSVKDGEEPTGFSIDVFKHAIKLLSYDLPYKFVSFHGSYDDLVDQVYFKNFGCAVGDITILSNRSNNVEFTQPYAESSLTMVVPVKPDDKTWLFVKPFTTKLWIVVTLVFVYTLFIVWYLERSNPEFTGSWRTQLSTAIWFTCSTIFFAQRESVRNNFTRFVMYVWFFTIFIVASSYTASLTSMLTVKQLEPAMNDVNTVRESNFPVGCNKGSFIRRYLEEVLHFHPDRIIKISSQDDYIRAFKNGTIKAAFLQLPHQRLLLSKNLTNYLDAGLKHRFGGFGFAFPKNSPYAKDFSNAFLKLTEDGTLNKLDEHWFTTYSPCSINTNQRLGLDNFKVLFIVTSVTSTVMLGLYISKGSLCSSEDQTSSNVNEEDALMNINQESSNEAPSQYPPLDIAENEMEEMQVGEWNRRITRLSSVYSFPSLCVQSQGSDSVSHGRLHNHRLRFV